MQNISWNFATCQIRAILFTVFANYALKSNSFIFIGQWFDVFPPIKCIDCKFLLVFLYFFFLFSISISSYCRDKLHWESLTYKLRLRSALNTDIINRNSPERWSIDAILLCEWFTCPYTFRWPYSLWIVIQSSFHWNGCLMTTGRTWTIREAYQVVLSHFLLLLHHLLLL